MTLKEGNLIGVIVNPSHVQTRQRNNLMHELAHFELKHVPTRVDVSSTGLLLLSDYSDEQEQEADWLAAALLLPRNALMVLRSSGRTVEQIAIAYGVIPTRLNIDRCPLPGSERSDALWMIGQKEPRPSARLDDDLVAFPDEGREFVLPQILPNRLHWIKFRRVWRQRQQSDVVRHAQAAAGLMPAGAVTDQNSVRTKRHLSADFAQVLVHRLGVDARHDNGGTDASGRADRAEQIGRVMTVVAHHQRARADRRPNVGMSALLPDPGFVLKPDFEVRCGCAFG